MAASQTIIQAAKMAYTPHKIDYSGYMQGILNVSKMLTEKIKSINSQKAEDQKSLEKMKTDNDTDFKPWDKVIEDYVDYGPGSPKEKLNNMKSLKQITLGFEDSQDKITAMAGPNSPGLSESIDPDIQNYLYSWEKGDFTQPIKFKDADGVEREYYINFTLEFEGMKPKAKIIGPKGTAMDMQGLTTLVNSLTRPQDGKPLTDIITKFRTATRDPEKVNETDFKTLKSEALTDINNLLTLGKLNSSETKVQVGKEHIKNSFMFDQKFFINEDEVNFLDWYMSGSRGGGKYAYDTAPQELKDSFKEILEENGLEEYSELSQKMKRILIQDIIKHDKNIDVDLNNFINAALGNWDDKKNKKLYVPY